MTQEPPGFLDRPPWGEDLTPYDRAHMALYMRLIDAEREGADWREVAQVIFGLDPNIEPDRSREVYQAHLERAQWMAERGYRHLVQADQRKQRL